MGKKRYLLASLISLLFLCVSCEKKPKVVTDVWNFKTSDVSSIDFKELGDCKEVTEAEDIQRILDIVGNAEVFIADGKNEANGGVMRTLVLNFQDGRRFAFDFISGKAFNDKGEIIYFEDSQEQFYVDDANRLWTFADEIEGIWAELDYEAVSVEEKYETGYFEDLGWK